MRGSDLEVIAAEGGVPSSWQREIGRAARPADRGTGRIIAVVPRSALWLLSSLAGVSATGEVVTIRPVDVVGRLPVEATAELLVDNWYAQQSIALPTRDGLILVPLTREWLCDQWPEGCAATVYITARILLSAPGRALLVSDPFQWPKEPGESSAPPAIAFPLAPAPVVEADSTLLVPLRPAGSRILHARDRAGRPLGGVTLDVAIYFSTGGTVR